MPATKVIRIARGSVNHRRPVGPAVWPHYDILWVHRGRLCLTLDGASVPVEIAAPGGVLITPNTRFSGKAIGGRTANSICHFKGEVHVDPTFVILGGKNALVAQSMLELLGRYQDMSLDEAVLLRMIDAVLDIFHLPEKTQALPPALVSGWEMTGRHLDQIRGLSDIARAVGMSESGFRALHRAHFPNSAGQNLLDLRMRHAAELLSSTGDKISDIARAVGYSNPESFSHSFRRHYGMSPRNFKKSVDQFA